MSLTTDPVSIVYDKLVKHLEKTNISKSEAEKQAVELMHSFQKRVDSLPNGLIKDIIAEYEGKIEGFKVSQKEINNFGIAATTKLDPVIERSNKIASSSEFTKGVSFAKEVIGALRENFVISGAEANQFLKAFKGSYNNISRRFNVTEDPVNNALEPEKSFAHFLTKLYDNYNNYQRSGFAAIVNASPSDESRDLAKKDFQLDVNNLVLRNLVQAGFGFTDGTAKEAALENAGSQYKLVAKKLVDAIAQIATQQNSKEK